jgi:hypothetical protein
MRSNRRRVQLILMLGSLVFVPAIASAHPLAPALLELTESAAHSVAVRWKTSIWKQAGVRLEPALPAGCVAIDEKQVQVDATSVTATWSAECNGGLAGGTVSVNGLDRSETDVLLRVTLIDGRSLQSILRRGDSAFAIPRQPTGVSVLAAYAGLGLHHILGGFDHLLFVFGLLLLVPARGSLVKTVTAFTAGHSVTLSLAALGYAAVPSAPVELAIAMTILALAVELSRPPGSRSLMRRRPWLMAFAFGLLHGLGFAGALREIGLPAGDIPAALFSFNAGIELGQLLFVAAVLFLSRPLLALRATLPAYTLRLPVYAMGTLAAFWTIERATTLLLSTRLGSIEG